MQPLLTSTVQSQHLIPATQVNAYLSIVKHHNRLIWMVLCTPGAGSQKWWYWC